jgi:very-short-patch-repair endonuclease
MSAEPLELIPWRELPGMQEQVIARRQARLGGMSEDAWQWRLDTGVWQTVLPGVAVTHSGQVTDRQRAWAAVLYGGEGAALSGDAALVEAGFARLEVAAIDIAVPAHRRVATQPGVRPHIVSRLAELVHPVRQPTQVRTPRALLDSMAWASSDRAAEWRLAAAVQQRLVTPSQVRAALDGAPRLKRRALANAVLLDVELGAHAQTELDFLRLLRRNHLPCPDGLQYRVRAGGTKYLDGEWRARRVYAELDGAHHRAAGTWDSDTLRANAVVVSQRHDRVILLRFTGSNMRHDESQMVAQLSAVLLD